MNSLINPAKYFYNTYSDLEYPNIKILPTSSRLPGMIRKVRKDLYTVISIIFLSQAPYRIIYSVEAIPQQVLKSIPQFFRFSIDS